MRILSIFFDTFYLSFFSFFRDSPLSTYFFLITRNSFKYRTRISRTFPYVIFHHFSFYREQEKQDEITSQYQSKAVQRSFHRNPQSNFYYLKTQTNEPIYNSNNPIIRLRIFVYIYVMQKCRRQFCSFCLTVINHISVKRVQNLDKKINRPFFTSLPN